MPRFVVLHHDWPSPHYDLMLERDGVLKTWRLSDEPLADVDAEPIGDHRLLYLDYEGPVSGSRGNVVRWDGGEMEWIDQQFRLCGARLRGLFTITLMAHGSWLMARMIDLSREQ